MSNAALVNFAGGETSPKSRGRFDIASYNSSCRKLVNFIAEVSGPARFRPGFRKSSTTLNSAVARLIPFQFSKSVGYMLEFTPGIIRIYKDGAPVIKYSAEGAPYHYYVVAPYQADELEDISFTQASEVMYLDHPSYSGQKLTCDSGGIFTLAPYTRTNDPFDGASINLTVNAVANVGGVAAVRCVSGTIFERGTRYTISAIDATGWSTLLNGLVVKVYDEVTPESATASGAWARLKLASTGAAIPALTGSTLSAIVGSAGSLATGTRGHPLNPAFYETRLVHAGTSSKPRTLFLSRSSSPATGDSRFEDFTGGVDPDHACFFSLSPIRGTSDYIVWAGGSTKCLLVGAFGGCYKVTGGGPDEPITPSSISVKQLDTFGCAPVPPALDGAMAYFVQRGGTTLRGIRYSLDADDLVSVDMCLNADQIGGSPLRRVVLQTAKPDVLWVAREDGVLCGMTVQNGERVAGWHRHRIGGANAKVIDVAVLPRVDAPDQLYIVAERTVDGATVRTVEVMNDDVTFPDPEDFFTGEGNKVVDDTRYKAAVYRRQEQYSHLDAESIYDGSDRGTETGGILTPSATTGNSILFTVTLPSGSSPDTVVFEQNVLGVELWKKPDMLTGIGSGKAVVVERISTLQVRADITEDFDSASAIPAGEWHIAATTVTGLSHLEGEKVAVVADGAVIADGKDPSDYAVLTVTGGSITLPDPAAVVHVGLPYEGMLITHNLEVGGQTGPAQDKARNISKMGIRFLSSLGCEFGTSLYKTEKVEFNSSENSSGRPSPVFSGIKTVHHSDTWLTDTGEKNVVIVQKLPLPCVVQFIDIQYTTGDEI